jgi:hypothetical protein
MITKKEAEEIMKIKGHVRGEGILTDLEYVRYREGEEGIKKLQEKLRELGWPLKFEEIKSTEWYPIGLDVLKTLVIKDLFNWTDKDVFEMGAYSARVSFLLKMFLRYFFSPQRVYQESPKYWRKNYDVGELETPEFNEKEKYMIFRLKNLKLHPINCINFAGYFLQVAKYVIKTKEITIEETKCVFKGDPYIEFVIRWK